MKRAELLKNLVPVMKDACVICNIGIPSQELYALDDQDNHFYMLGSMGLCCSIGLGLAMACDKPVVSIEGDGAMLMNMGALATIAHKAPPNYTLLIVDNGSYGSTGDQPTFTSGTTSLSKIAQGAGIENVVECSGEQAPGELQRALSHDGTTVIVAKVSSGNMKAAPIPLHPIIIRERFKQFVTSK